MISGGSPGAPFAFAYPIDFHEHEDGRIVARIGDIHGAVTEGADLEEAFLGAQDALEEALCAAMAADEAIPRPSSADGRPLAVPGTLIAAKVALYQAMLEGGISQTELGRRLNLAENEIARYLNPRHKTAPDALDAALAALGRRLLLTMEEF